MIEQNAVEHKCICKHKQNRISHLMYILGYEEKTKERNALSEDEVRAETRRCFANFTATEFISGNNLPKSTLQGFNQILLTTETQGLGLCYWAYSVNGPGPFFDFHITITK